MTVLSQKTHKCHGTDRRAYLGISDPTSVLAADEPPSWRGVSTCRRIRGAAVSRSRSVCRNKRDHMMAAGLSANSTRAARQVGYQTSSLSRNARYSPRARRMPVLRAALGPPFSCLI